MVIIDFNEYKQNNKSYGGRAGIKVGITYNNEDYIIKYPQNFKERPLENVELSYSNSPISEYIGSKIYKSFNIPVHEVLLGKRNNKIVVACKDFIQNNEIMKEFKELKNMYEPSISDENNTNSEKLNFNEILNIINNHILLKDIKKEVINRFWQMFIVDFIIGNTDRNNGNWGFIFKNNQYKLAPVYDNGNSLCSKISDNQIKTLSLNKYKNYLINTRSCYYDEIAKEQINTYHYLKTYNNIDMYKNLEYINNNIDLQKIKNIIYEIPIINEDRKNFYYQLISERCKLLKEILINKNTLKEKIQQKIYETQEQEPNIDQQQESSGLSR